MIVHMMMRSTDGSGWVCERGCRFKERGARHVFEVAAPLANGVDADPVPPATEEPAAPEEEDEDEERPVDPLEILDRLVGMMGREGEPPTYRELGEEIGRTGEWARRIVQSYANDAATVLEALPGSERAYVGMLARRQVEMSGEGRTRSREVSEARRLGRLVREQRRESLAWRRVKQLQQELVEAMEGGGEAMTYHELAQRLHRTWGGLHRQIRSLSGGKGWKIGTPEERERWERMLREFRERRAVRGRSRAGGE